MKKRVLAGMVVAAAAGAMLVPIGSGSAESKPKEVVPTMDLSAFPATRPDAPLRMLFIHHSCGGQLLAAPGASKERDDCIYVSHPNGGGLKSLLEEQGYEVHEASYGSDIGNDTDMFHWLPKFTGKMDKILRVAHQDELYPDDRRNQIIAFKSCFPNNEFTGEGAAPGNPAGPDLTVWNAKATLTAVLPELEKHPETLFVYVTAPPNAPKAPKVRLWKWIARRVLGRGGADADRVAHQGELAREFNNWAVSPEGWLKDYKQKNVVVFDYYGILTDRGRSNLSAYGSNDGTDSHPTSEGNRRAAAEFVPMLNRAVRRLGRSPLTQ